MKNVYNAVVGEIDRIARKYANDNAEKVVDTINNVVSYKFNLGAREVGLLFCPDEHLLCGGLKNGIGRITNRVEKEYKNLLRDIECDIETWYIEHPAFTKRKELFNGK